MEVEFDVQMTSADLYDYMLHHTFTSPSGLIGAVAGALMIVAGFAGSGALCTIADKEKITAITPRTSTFK